MLFLMLRATLLLASDEPLTLSLAENLTITHQSNVM
jgi:hypothetical protein